MHISLRITFAFLLFYHTGYTQTFPDSPTEDHQLVIGTNVSLVPPPMFSQSSNFKGFQNPADQSSMIMIMEIPGPFDQVVEGFNVEMLKSRGMDLIDKKKIKIATYDGLLMQMEQSANGIQFLKHLLVYGDSTATTMVNGACLKDSVSLGSSIKESVLSTYINTDLSADPRAALNYNVMEVAGGLQFHSVIGNGMLFNRDLKTPTESEDKATLFTDKSFANISIEDKKVFCVSRIKQYPDDFSVIEAKGINEINIDGLDGYELYAQNNDNPDEEMYQIILFDDQVGYYLFVGTYLSGSEEALHDIKMIIMTFKRKA